MGWTRVLAALAMVVLTSGLYWLVTDERFRVTWAEVRIEGVRYADADEVRAALGQLALEPNIFRVRAAELATSVRALDEVLDADVRASLPGSVEVRVHERRPIFVLHSGERAWLIDVDGVLFAPASVVTPRERGDGRTGSALPAVEDGRLHERPLAQGDRLSAEDLLVMRQLLALTPERLGSGRDALYLRIDQGHGYVLEAPGRWYAVFGHYTPNTRTPDIVPAQVQCLRALLRARESDLWRVFLPGVPGNCGTFLPARRADRRARERGSAEGEGAADRGARTGRPRAARTPAA